MSSDFDPVMRVVNLLTDNGCYPKRARGGFQAKCPAHEDNRASLTLGQGNEGAVLKCHAGCTADAITAALGITLADLFAAHDNSNTASDQPVSTFDYHDEDGNLLFQVVRNAGKKFLQRRKDPVTDEWVWSLGNTRRVPYRLRELIEAVKHNETVYVVEGEKDVHSLVALGLTATCNPGGAGKWRPEFAPFFAGANVAILPDNDRVGDQHAEAVASSLMAHVRNVRIVRLPGLSDKGDVTDWLAAGGTKERLERLVTSTAPETHGGIHTFTAASLMDEEFKDVVMPVPGVIAEGCTLLVGAPKIGKSWLSFGVALAVAMGTNALGTIPVEQGDVLYLALEDTPRRLKSRMTALLGGQMAPEALHFATEWPRLGVGGLEAIERWLQDRTNARLVIIDTWAKIKSAVGDENSSMYQADYAGISAVKGLADKYGVAIVLVHHQRKAADTDALNTVAGSTGLTGAADATVILTRARGAEEGRLYVTGRDVEESTSVMAFQSDTGHWLWMGEAEEVEEQRSENAVIDLLVAADSAMTPKEVAAELEMKDGTAKWLLSKMAQEGRIKKLGRGKYVHLDYNDNGPSGAVVTATTPGFVQPAMQPAAQPAGEDGDPDDLEAAVNAAFGDSEWGVLGDEDEEGGE